MHCVAVSLIFEPFCYLNWSRQTIQAYVVARTAFLAFSPNLPSNSPGEKCAVEQNLQPDPAGVGLVSEASSSTAQPH